VSFQLTESQLRQIIREEIGLLDESLDDGVTEASRGRGKVNPKYLTRDKAAMRREIEKHAHKRDDDPSAYTSHSKGGWRADYDEKGKRYQTRPSKSTKAFQKRFGEVEDDDGEERDTPRTLDPDLDDDLLLDDFPDDELEEMYEALSSPVRKALKNKADKANAPLGALTTIYRKGLAAWKTGHRPGTSQQQWAMARVNSVLTGGKARSVDAAQWDQIRKHRGKKRKKD
jgi:hypothetical protein